MYYFYPALGWLYTHIEALYMFVGFGGMFGDCESFFAHENLTGSLSTAHVYP